MTRGSLIVFCLSLALPFAAGTASPQAAERTSGALARPGEPCHVAPLPTWTKQERWVWQHVCQGTLADFTEGSRYGGTLDPHAMTHWPEGRVLRPTFLETVLLHEPYRSALTRNGVHIHGAWFKDPLDLSFAVLAHPLLLENSRFDQDVDLRSVRSSKVIELGGSRFRGPLNLSSLRVEGSLLMSRGQFAEVNLLSARIDSQLAVDGSRFSGKTNMESIRVSEDLLAHDAQFTDLSLLGARIDGALVLSDARVIQPVPGGGQLNMDNLRVGDSLFMRNVEVATDPDVVLTAADIGVNLDITGARLPSLDLTATRVRGEFRLGWGDDYARWRKGAKLTLRNSDVGAVQDHPNAWPDELDLVGFTYARLGGANIDGPNDLARRDVDWFEAWLLKQKSYAPQPYEHLASVLRQAGHEDKANDVLYAGRDRKRRVAPWPQWLWLTSLWIFIGYGYRIYRALYWVAGLVIVGALVFRRTEEAKQNRMPYGLTYSFDMLLPAIKLRERHYQIELAGWARYYFYFHRIMGYVLAGFLAAGLSGLTR